MRGIIACFLALAGIILFDIIMAMATNNGPVPLWGEILNVAVAIVVVVSFIVLLVREGS